MLVPCFFIRGVIFFKTLVKIDREVIILEFRPCIDIHNGKVKQIVGGSLTDKGDHAQENFVSGQDASFFAEFYQKKGCKGGHVILLNPDTSPFYEATKQQALAALSAYPGGLQVGGGIRQENAAEFLKAGASHVIVTSYVFRDGKFHEERLTQLVREVGREHIVLDLSCRKKDGAYYIVTDRWQNYTQVQLNPRTMEKLADSCDEFLIHAVDVEGKASGIEEELVSMLGETFGTASGKARPITYAGGVHSYEDIALLKELGHGKINVTIGSALDLFGGELEFDRVLELV